MLVADRGDGRSIMGWVEATSLRGFDYLVMVICLILLPSAVLHGLLGLDERAVFAALSPLVLVGAVLTNRLRLRQPVQLTIGAVLLVGLIGSIVAGAASQFLMGAVLAVAIICGHALCITLMKPRALRMVSVFTLVLLVGAVVGLLYAFVGGEPLVDVQVGYRTTSLYLSTFSLAQAGSFIRPSGLFDEPGAFAMFVVIVTMFNDLFGQNRRLNILLLSLAVFTGSLAGLVLLAWYLITSGGSGLYKRRTAVVIVALLGVSAFFYFIAPNSPISMAMESFYSGRLEIVDGRLAGDNRSNQVEEFFSLVDDEIVERGAVAAERTYDQYDQSSNPFSIVYGYGLIISLPYFAMLIWLLAVTIRNRFQNSYTSLGLFFLLLQRPYIFNMMWAVIIAAITLALYAVSRSPPKGVAQE